MENDPISKVSELEALLKELEEKANAATPGPWERREYNQPYKNSVETVSDHYSCQIAYWNAEYKDCPNAPNADFIAAANPDTIKKLIGVIRKQQEALEWIKEYSHQTVFDKDGNFIKSMYGMDMAIQALEDCEKIVRE